MKSSKCTEPLHKDLYDFFLTWIYCIKTMNPDVANVSQIQCNSGPSKNPV